MILSESVFGKRDTLCSKLSGDLDCMLHLRAPSLPPTSRLSRQLRSTPPHALAIFLPRVSRGEQRRSTLSGYLVSSAILSCYLPLFFAARPFSYILLGIPPIGFCFGYVSSYCYSLCTLPINVSLFYFILCTTSIALDENQRVVRQSIFSSRLRRGRERERKEAEAARDAGRQI